MPQSELLTHDGYPAVKLENGSYMTEYSITVTDSRLNNGRPTNIPSLWERKIVDQDTAVNKAIQSKKEYKSFDTIKDAVSDSERKSNAGGANAPKEYNRGGTVRNLLATGGMMQEGGTTDPVSGNDVPAGSLKEEVRDDIPAQLSPGEFVFPADVTRYIGLDKLMQIREAAKEGLKEMESKGQMGNAEEVEGDAVDEDKFSTNIDEIISGLGSANDSESNGFAEGGVVKDDPAYKDAPIRGFKMVQYEDPETKAVRYIPFINGKPLLPIPKGYVEKKAAVAPVTPPTTPPVEGQPVTPVGGGGGDRGGRSTDTEGGGGREATVNDAGVEGFGDVQGGTNRNVGRAAGFVAGLVNPVFGLLVSAGSQYAIKENNKKVAAANVAAIDASSLREMGFDAKDIRAAQEAAAKATLEGKSAKQIAEAAANAAALSADPNSYPKGEYGTVTSLDALIGITNGFNTARPEVMKADAMPDSLKNQVPVGTWDTVVAAIKEGLTPEQAVEKAIKVMDTSVDSYFTGEMTDKEADARLKAATDSLDAKQLGVPAGEYDKVIGDIKDGYTPEQAIKRAEERAFGLTDSEMEDKDAQTRQEAKEAAERVQAERNAEVARQEKERTEQAEREQAERDAQTRQEAAERAQAEKERAEREQAAREIVEAVARSGGGGGTAAPGAGAFPGGGGAPPSGTVGGGGGGDGGGGGGGDGGGADPNAGRSDSDRDRGD